VHANFGRLAALDTTLQRDHQFLEILFGDVAMKEPAHALTPANFM
jgi:hypothetical protein